MLFHRLILISSIALMSACTGAQSEQCKDTCQQETTCAAQKSSLEGNYPWDLDECIGACVALERDAEGRKQVESHVRCVKEAAGDCEKILNCQ
jgi:hypothetical protein